MIADTVYTVNGSQKVHFGSIIDCSRRMKYVLMICCFVTLVCGIPCTQRQLIAPTGSQDALKSAFPISNTCKGVQYRREITVGQKSNNPEASTQKDTLAQENNFAGSNQNKSIQPLSVHDNPLWSQLFQMLIGVAVFLSLTLAAVLSIYMLLRKKHQMLKEKCSILDKKSVISAQPRPRTLLDEGTKSGKSEYSHLDCDDYSDSTDIVLKRSALEASEFRESHGSQAIGVVQRDRDKGNENRKSSLEIKRLLDSANKQSTGDIRDGGAGSHRHPSYQTRTSASILTLSDTNGDETSALSNMDKTSDHGKKERKHGLRTEVKSRNQTKKDNSRKHRSREKKKHKKKHH